MKLEEIFQRHGAKLREAATAQQRASELDAARRRMAQEITPKLEEIRQCWDSSAGIFKQNGFASEAEVIPWQDAPTASRAALLHVSRNPPGLFKVMGGYSSQFLLTAEGDLDTGILVFAARDLRTNAMTVLDGFPNTEVVRDHAEHALERFVQWFLERG